MKKLIIILPFVIINAAIAQKKSNPVLKKQLDSVIILDQKYREILTLLSEPGKRDSVAKTLSLTVNEASTQYWKLQNHIDSSNVAFIENVLNKYGYPGKSLVGIPTNESAWNIIQHSKKINQYIPIIKKAAEEKELPFYLYAMMFDRQLLSEGKEQVYGSQVQMQKLKNGKVEAFVWPIKDADKVNQLHKEAGFSTTVEQNAKRLGVVYRVVKMDEVK